MGEFIVTQFRIPAISFLLAIVISVSGMVLPTSLLFTQSTTVSDHRSPLVCSDKDAGIIERVTNSESCSIEKGVIQHNRVIAFLSNFDALRPATIIAFYDFLSAPLFLLKQEQNSLYKEHFHNHLPQKKPEDSYWIII